MRLSIHIIQICPITTVSSMHSMCTGPRLLKTIALVHQDAQGCSLNPASLVYTFDLGFQPELQGDIAETLRSPGSTVEFYASFRDLEELVDYGFSNIELVGRTRTNMEGDLALSVGRVFSTPSAATTTPPPPFHTCDARGRLRGLTPGVPLFSFTSTTSIPCRHHRRGQGQVKSITPTSTASCATWGGLCAAGRLQACSTRSCRTSATARGSVPPSRKPAASTLSASGSADEAGPSLDDGYFLRIVAAGF